MTKKEKTLRAIDKIIELYESYNPEHSYFNPSTCPMCLIHDQTHFRGKIQRETGCRGCPLANRKGFPGCADYETFREAEDIYCKSLDTILASSGIDITQAEDIYCKSLDPRENFKKRACFYKKMKKIVEKWPKEIFTIKGWKFHDWSDIDKECLK